jgi:hypothetical protein
MHIINIYKYNKQWLPETNHGWNLLRFLTIAKVVPSDACAHHGDVELPMAVSGSSHESHSGLPKSISVSVVRGIVGGPASPVEDEDFPLRGIRFGCGLGLVGRGIRFGCGLVAVGLQLATILSTHS